jgi:hypothetical protein
MPLKALPGKWEAEKLFAHGEDLKRHTVKKCLLGLRGSLNPGLSMYHRVWILCCDCRRTTSDCLVSPCCAFIEYYNN